MPESPASFQDGTMMAIVCHRYGSPDVLQLAEVARPVLTDDRVMVRVKASSVNPADKYSMRGPLVARFTGNGLFRPKLMVQGTDVSGIVEAVGKNVTRFKPGDEVFGVAPGSFAEYACSREDRLAIKPANITFEQAAGAPIAGITALQGLRDKGWIRSGQKVLVNGASGGVGTFAVQIAKSFGAEVTAVCSTMNVDRVRSLGADRVIDYSKEDFVRGGREYDIVVDVAGVHSISDTRSVLVPDGIYVLVGSNPKRGMFRLLTRVLKVILLSKMTDKVTFFIAKITSKDLNVLGKLMETGEVTTVVDRTYKLKEVPDAMRYLEEGHARAKVVITV